MDQDNQDSNVISTNFGNLSDFLRPIFSDGDLKRFKLEQSAVKVLSKFIDNKNQYLSMNNVRHNFKKITTQDVFIICNALERLGYVLGKLDRGRNVYKFNEFKESSTNVSAPMEHINLAQKRFEEKLCKKIERAAKTIERYKGIGQLTDTITSKKKEIESKKEGIEIPRKLDNSVYIPQSVRQKTAQEKHEEGIAVCGGVSGGCRICAFEQEQETGLGI